MIDRRVLIAGGAGLASGLALNPHSAFADTPTTYEDAVRSTWAPFRADGGPRELVRYATLAANSHNTQPWTFKISEGNIAIAPDFGRRCPAVDPDDHHLFVSLGCAAENLVQAAAAAGLKATPSLVADAVSIMLEPAPAKRSQLLDMISIRQSTRAVYDGKPLANETLRLLEQAGTGDGIAVPLEQFFTQLRLLTNARSVTGRIFTVEEQAQSHCQVGNLGLALLEMLNWIEAHSSE